MYTTPIANCLTEINEWIKIREIIMSILHSINDDKVTIDSISINDYRVKYCDQEIKRNTSK